MDNKCHMPSNEEVIEELTKNLEKSCIEAEDVTGMDNKKISDNISMESEDLEAEEIQSNLEEDEYFVDDIALKDRDLNLTEKQKQELKNESENLKTKGNGLFRDGNYTAAASIYTEALKMCPLIFEKERAILYANRAASKVKFMSDKTSAIIDCTKAIELDTNYVKAYLRRAHFYEDVDKLDEALADYKKVLTFDPVHSESISAIQRLEPLITERNEKLKEEMMGKLKELGNMILKPFGLSTNNFQMQKDEASGGYSLKFNQNPT